eukprot:596198-Prymnesium_polylepis.1
MIPYRPPRHATLLARTPHGHTHTDTTLHTHDSTHLRRAAQGRDAYSFVEASETSRLPRAHTAPGEGCARPK